MKKPELIIFDMDGLMFDTERVTKKYYIQTALKYGYTITDELFYQLIGGNRERNRALLKQHLGESYPYEQVSKECRELKHQEYRQNGMGIKQGLVELLEYGKAQGIKMAIASSSNLEIIEHHLNLSKLGHYFDFIMSGDQVVNSKPHPEIFLKVCEHFNILPENALVLEDSKNGIIAASSGNIPVICVPDLVMHEQDILDLTYATITSLDKVIGLID